MGLLVKDILKIGEKRLKEAGIADYKVDAEELFCYSYHLERNGLFMNWAKEIDDDNCEQYFSLLDIRCSGKPLQYITGHQEFMGFDFEVNEHVLIPRQDTENLVMEALEMIKTGGRVKKILDLCTGSGAVAVALAKMTAAEIIASDISAEALSVAKRNAAKNGAQVSFDCGDLFHPFQKKLRKTRFDMVVSNPPYIPSADISGLQTEVRDYEPHLALDGGPDGLAFYKRIVREAPDFLKKNGSLLLEIGFDQADAVTEMAALDGRYCGVRICKDLAGLDRIAVLTLL